MLLLKNKSKDTEAFEASKKEWQDEMSAYPASYFDKLQKERATKRRKVVAEWAEQKAKKESEAKTDKTQKLDATADTDTHVHTRWCSRCLNEFSGPAAAMLADTRVNDWCHELYYERLCAACASLLPEMKASALQL